MKLAWFPVLCLLVIHAVDAFKELFGHHQQDKPSILDILTKPKIPGVNIQLGSPFGSGSFGFGIGFGGQFQPSGAGVHLPPKDTGYPWEDKKKVGPRPNWGEEKDGYPKPGSYDDGKDDYPRPGSYEDDKEYPNPGAYDYDKKDYPKPEDKKDYPKPEEKDSLPDWDDIGEEHPKSEKLMNGDLIGGGLIQPRFNRRRNKRFSESRVFHVPLLFRSNGKPYQVKIRSNPNSLTKGNEEA